MLYACLAANGIMSAFYHYNNSIGYGLLDRMSMVLLGLNTSFSETINIHAILALMFG